MAAFVYKGAKTRQISFPLGGIGSGSIGLSGSGRLIDWEIFNRPNKGSVNGFSHFAVKAEKDGELLDARILNGDLHPPYTGQYGKEEFRGFGYGPYIETMAGFPHFEESEFIGQFPIATMLFKDRNFPGEAELTAFNPFIPLNDDDSSIPGAFFEIRLHNCSEHAVDYTVCLSVRNPFQEATYNRFEHGCVGIGKESEGNSGISRIYMSSNEYRPEDTGYGDMTVSTDNHDVSYQECWYRGGWFDSLGVFWKNFISALKLQNRQYASEGKGDMCSLAAHIRVKPGETGTVRFCVTWSFPNNYNYWKPCKKKCLISGAEAESEKDVTWMNYYAVLFKDSAESGVYSLMNWGKLYALTLKFKDALFSTTVAVELLDAISANLSVLKSPTVLRLEDGSFYGWEGVHEKSGSCEGSCTHVWNYTYALPFLFPKLERSMRDLDFRYNQRQDGGMSFRLQLPLGRGRSDFRPCADGQFGGVIKAYRDWKICGDDGWLKSNWEAIKKSIEFAWAETNADKWDLDKDGVLEGRQHHTLDMELFGPNSWLQGYYLGALKAGAEMARHLGDKEKAAEYAVLFERGKQWADRHLFNGEYYLQTIDLKDKRVLYKFISESDMIIGNSGTVADAYWNEEAQELKYQIADGCEIDQVSAQWHANICGLGEIFDKTRVREALKSLYKYNFKKSMREWHNPCRIFCLNGEAGLVICDWPRGKKRPMVPIPYAEECMTGFEYQAAAHMIQEGLVDEGIEIVKAIRDRYDGEKRNPWNEIECGSNYARSMASYSLLLAISGFEFDAVSESVGFDPICFGSVEEGKDVFKCFWSLDSGWGLFEKVGNECELKVLFGTLAIKTLKLGFIRNHMVNGVSLSHRAAYFTQSHDHIVFPGTLYMKCDDVLQICLLSPRHA